MPAWPNPEQMMLLTETHKQFVRSSAALGSPGPTPMTSPR